MAEAAFCAKSVGHQVGRPDRNRRCAHQPDGESPQLIKLCDDDFYELAEKTNEVAAKRLKA